ncbi:hypothetical protein TcarDRAFT_2258 [Thermosinus carboxydivorans Nor1]|uniref:Colicin D immunity protein domain-containing protein n=1 Tax=Thermosinus carboxydivorans Nor1 TaxID=401526 RepID=A1HNE9_9FIRM|nr:hypothetical protein [Thermosinus carboxydivorans]EAX48308.1 hypothetical protein TcarDRAFT_2258 [Thermosinus carboxydivorans Nor1]
MTAAAEKLKAICLDFLNQKIDLFDYLEAFAETYAEVEDALNDEEYEVFDQISEDNGMAIFADAEYDADFALSEEELREQVAQHLAALG